MNPVDLRLYGIIDPDRTADRNPIELVKEAIAGGVTLIQYRDKQADDRLRIEYARALVEALQGTGVPLLINDRVDVAMASGAQGVHLGQDDMHPRDARRILGPGAIIGLTVKTADQADGLVRMPIDYSCIGGVFATASKDNPSPPIGLDGLAKIAFRARLASSLPVGAIAGIDASNAQSVIAAGVDGIAVISALFAAPNPQAEARRLREIVDHTLSFRGVGT